MTDIVERLHRSVATGEPLTDSDALEIIDEIERLRGELHELERYIALNSIGWFGGKAQS